MKRRGKRLSSYGFSLVEVAFSMGLLSFSMLLILGLLPVGLDNVRQAMVQVNAASIARQVRADLQQLPLAGANSIQSLNSQNYYYTQQGIKLPNATGAYFQAAFLVSDPSTEVAGAPPTINSSFSSSAANVTVTLTYPLSAPTASRQSQTFSLFEAGQ